MSDGRSVVKGCGRVVCVGVMYGTKFAVRLVEGGGGEFWWPCSAGSRMERPEMRVGRDQAWHAAVKTLVHELFEAGAMWERCLFERTTWLTDASSGRHVLHMDHAQFTEVCNEVGDALTYIMPRLVVAAKWRACE